jgi:hypothetical protein
MSTPPATPPPPRTCPPCSRPRPSAQPHAPPVLSTRCCLPPLPPPPTHPHLCFPARTHTHIMLVPRKRTWTHHSHRCASRLTSTSQRFALPVHNYCQAHNLHFRASGPRLTASESLSNVGNQDRSRPPLPGVSAPPCECPPLLSHLLFWASVFCVPVPVCGHDSNHASPPAQPFARLCSACPPVRPTSHVHTIHARNPPSPHRVQPRARALVPGVTTLATVSKSHTSCALVLAPRAAWIWAAQRPRRPDA